MPKRKPIALPLTAQMLRARFKDFPALDVVERRLNDPHDPGSLPILLADDPDPCCGDIGHALDAKPGAARCRVCKVPFRTWYIRWANLGEENRWSTLKARGYVKVRKAELRDPEDVAGLGEVAGDDLVTRGDRRSEVLVKMPWPFYVEIRRERERQYLERRKPAKLKEAIVASADRDLGDEAAQTLHDGLKVETAKRHRSTLGEEIGVSD